LWLFVTAVPDFSVRTAFVTPILENHPKKYDELKSRLNGYGRVNAIDHRDTTSVIALMMAAADDLKRHEGVILSALSGES